MAQTVAFALIGAFILSLTYIPMMSSLVLSRKKKEKDNISRQGNGQSGNRTSEIPDKKL